jgi:hypothetical protein
MNTVYPAHHVLSVLFLAPLVLFAGYIAWLVVPAVVDAVVPAVIDTLVSR